MEEPRRLGERYELGEVIGRGGMAEVHIGRDLRLGRTVAVKLLRSDLARDPAFQSRFRREAQSAASLNHPNVAAVYDTGEDDLNGNPVPYIVMEFVDGATLRDMMKSGRKLQPSRALEITDGILAALDYSHRMGIVHRDIKPGNVMVSKAGSVKVMDFGIARALADSAATMTSTSGGVMGTAQYLSPEQARGEQVDARSDLYSTGVVLYELLTGRPPFMGDSPVSVAYQHVRETPEQPSSVDSEVPASSDAIVMRALSKNPSDRYQTAAAMRSDVERALKGQSVAPVAATDETQIIAPLGAPTVTPTAAAAGGGGRRANPAVIVGILLGVLALGALAFLFGRSLFGGGTDVRVPALVGMSQQQAQTELQAKGLKLGNVTTEQSDKPSGTVVNQDPKADVQVKEGSAVDVTLSAGPGQVAVPTVVGLNKDTAVSQLQKADLQLGAITTQDSDKPADEVISSDPAQGSLVEKGTKVNLTVSSGRVGVPNVVGSTEAKARSDLEAAGFNVQSQTVETNSPAPGIVVSQQPPAGTVLPTGRTVTITVAKAKPSPSPTPTPSTSTTPTTSPSASPTG